MFAIHYEQVDEPENDDASLHHRELSVVRSTGRRASRLQKITACVNSQGTAGVKEIELRYLWARLIGVDSRHLPLIRSAEVEPFGKGLRRRAGTDAVFVFALGVVIGCAHVQPE